jgi:hypothetical protein
MDRLRTVSKRWGDVVLIGVLGGLLWGVLDRAFATLFEGPKAIIAGVASDFPITSCVYVVVFGIISFWLLHKATNLRPSHFERVLTYPPAVVGVLPALGVVYLLHASEFTHTSTRDIFWAAGLCGAAILLVVFGSIACGALHDAAGKWLPRRKPTVQSTELADATVEFRTWYEMEAPIKEPSEDRFDHRYIAKRVARYLTNSKSTTIGIIGGYGSGKSGVVNMAKRTVFADGRKVWFCDIDCWGFKDSSAVIERILEDIVHRIGLEVDCGGMRSLPSRYIRAISAAHPSLAATEALLGNQLAPEDVIGQLDRVLMACDFTLVVIIQDLDRNTRAQFDTSVVSALLDRFRSTSRVSFILASGNTPNLDFTRLCEHIEPMPRLPRDLARSELQRLRNTCLAEFAETDIDTGSVEERRLFDTDVALGWRTPLTESVVTLVSTPRILKAVIRRVASAWRTLHGELDIDDLIVLTSLRHAAPEAVDFLHQFRHQLLFGVNDGYTSSLGHTQKEQNEHLISRFNEVAKDSRWDFDAVRNLVDFLFPKSNTLLGGQANLDRKALQRVGADAHVDYWSRAFAEELAPNEVRDQEILHAIDASNANDEAINSLTDRMLESEKFSAGWEYFSSRMRTPTLHTVAEILFSKHLQRDGANAKGDHDSIIRAWRRINRRPLGPNSATWLVSELKKSLPVSLGFYNDLVHYWTGSSGIVDAEGGRSIRKEMLSFAKSHFAKSKSKSAFCDVLSRVHPWAIRHFVLPPDQNSKVVEGDWKWLRPILGRAVKHDPDLVIPQLARIMVLSKDSFVYEEEVDAKVSRRVWVIDRGIAKAVFGERCKHFVELVAMATFSSEDPEYEGLIGLRDSARDWLAEWPEQKQDVRA